MFIRSHKEIIYPLANAIVGKIGCTASEEVILELIKSKCIPVLLYGLCLFHTADADKTKQSCLVHVCGVK